MNLLLRIIFQEAVQSSKVKEISLELHILKKYIEIFLQLYKINDDVYVYQLAIRISSWEAAIRAFEPENCTAI